MGTAVKQTSKYAMARRHMRELLAQQGPGEFLSKDINAKVAAILLKEIKWEDFGVSLHRRAMILANAALREAIEDGTVVLIRRQKSYAAKVLVLRMAWDIVENRKGQHLITLEAFQAAARHFLETKQFHMMGLAQCNCTLREKLVGDGCQACNPDWEVA